MAAFPSAHFPASIPTRKEACDVFDAFGCLHACDVGKGEDGRLQKSFQYNITGAVGQKLIPAGTCVPFLPPNQVSSIVPAKYEDYITANTFKNMMRMNVEQQVEEFCMRNPDVALGPIRDIFSDEELQQLSVMGVTKQQSKQNKVKHLRRNETMDAISDAISSLGIARRLLYQLTSEETHGQLERMYHNELYYGGCLAYESCKPQSSIEGSSGLLFYPSGNCLDTLNIHALESSSSPYFRPSTSLKTQFPMVGCIRQVDTHRAPMKRDIFSAIRTDYHGYLVKCRRKEALDCRLIHDFTSQYRINSISVSPHVDGEFLFSNEKGEVNLINHLKEISTSCPFSASKKYMPTYAHFAAHPRLMFAHTKDQAYHLDFRIPNMTKTQEIPLFELPSTCLPTDQYFCVARQHPSNPFYHYLATQHYVFLMDERFPQHTVVQWPHLLSTPPSYLNLVPAISSHTQTTSDDLLLAASYSSREVHCFQSSSLCGKPACSTRGPWKIDDNNAWLDKMSVVPSHGGELVRERISRPLIGICAAKFQEDQQQSITVFKLSEAGDVYNQVFKVGNDDEFSGATLNRDSLSEPCERKCKSFFEKVIALSEERTDSDIKFKTRKTKKILKDITLAKNFDVKVGGCSTCQPSDSRPCTGTDKCNRCGLPGNQSSTLAEAFPHGILTQSTRVKHPRSLALARGVSREKIYRDPFGKKLWESWQNGEGEPSTKKLKEQERIKKLKATLKKKKKLADQLKEAASSNVSANLVHSITETPSLREQEKDHVQEEEPDSIFTSLRVGPSTEFRMRDAEGDRDEMPDGPATEGASSDEVLSEEEFAAWPSASKEADVPTHVDQSKTDLIPRLDEQTDTAAGSILQSEGQSTTETDLPSPVFPYSSLNSSTAFSSFDYLPSQSGQVLHRTEMEDLDQDSKTVQEIVPPTINVISLVRTPKKKSAKRKSYQMGF